MKLVVREDGKSVAVVDAGGHEILEKVPLNLVLYSQAMLLGAAAVVPQMSPEVREKMPALFLATVVKKVADLLGMEALDLHRMLREAGLLSDPGAN